jgi:hypothetical protein
MTDVGINGRRASSGPTSVVHRRSTLAHGRYTDKTRSVRPLALDRGLPTAQEVPVCMRVFCASVCEPDKDYVKLLRDP